MRITSQAFHDGEKIPEAYTMYGQNRIPPIHFEDVPEKARSLALVMDDPDATRGTFSHWLLFNVDPKIKDIKENSVPVMATEGKNDFGQIEYIVDQFEQMPSGAINPFQIGNEALLPGILCFFLKHLTVSDDRIEGGAQLVTHVCQKLAFGLRASTGSLFRLHQLFVHLLELFFMLFDLSKHLVEAIDEKTYLIARALFCSHRVILLL